MGVARARFGARAYGWGAAAFVALAALSSCLSTPDDAGAGPGPSDGADASSGSDARADSDDAASADARADSDDAASADARADSDDAASADARADGDAADDGSPIDAGGDAAEGGAPGDGGGDGASDGGGTCAPVVDVPPPTCSLHPLTPSVVYQAYVPSATTPVTIQYIAPSPGGNTAYAIRFPCLDSPDVTCISGTADYTFVPGAAGSVYVVGYGATIPRIIVGNPAPPNATCATPTPLVLDQSQVDTNDYGDSLPRFFSFTLPTDMTITVEGRIPAGTIYLHVYASCGGASLADSGAASSGPSPAIARSAPIALPAGAYILEADASLADGLSVIVNTH